MIIIMTALSHQCFTAEFEQNPLKTGFGVLHGIGIALLKSVSTTGHVNDVADGTVGKCSVTADLGHDFFGKIVGLFLQPFAEFEALKTQHRP
ncbi:MAG: hypothetical protein R3F37_19275 [Candidatus Competibacteraceae bacterium]